MEHGGHDLGQILPLVALRVAMALGLAVLTVDPDDRRSRVHELAVANGAVLEAFRRVGTSVEVTALVRRARATARAVAVPCRGDCCRPHAYP